MKLNHRILLLIAPVILLSAAASSYIIYTSQKNALLKRTDSYLQLNIEKLASHYRQAQSLVSSYAFTLAKSDIIRHYFSLEKNPYRELELVDNLRETLQILQPNEKQLVSLSILNGHEELLYYAENSSDPFAELDPKVMAYIKQRFASTQKTLISATPSTQRVKIFWFATICWILRHSQRRSVITAKTCFCGGVCGA